jgi:hypothetical protein
VECDVVSASESMLDITNLVCWNGNIDNLNMSEHNWEEVVECDIEQDNTIENLESPELGDISATPNVPWLN